MSVMSIKEDRVKHIITLFIVPGMGVNVEAWDLIQQLPNVEAKSVACPRQAGEWFEYPFVRDQRGETYYGVEGVRHFAEHLRLVREGASG